MAGDDPNDAGGGTGASRHVRAKVNGRAYRIRRSDGLIEKGPKALVGQYLAPTQVERLADNPEFYGHLCTAETPDQRRLAEMEFLLMEHKANKGDLMLVEGMVVVYNGQPGWRVDVIAGDRVNISNGRLVRVVSRDKLQESASLDYRSDQTPEGDEINWSGPAADPSRTREMDVELDIDIESVVTERINKLMESDEFVDALAERIAKRLGDTSLSTGVESPGDEAVQ